MKKVQSLGQVSPAERLVESTDSEFCSTVLTSCKAAVFNHCANILLHNNDDDDDDNIMGAVSSTALYLLFGKCVLNQNLGCSGPT